MTKNIFFVAACLLCAACSKNIDTNTNTGTGDATTFQKGQTVTLNVSAEADAQATKVSSELNADGKTIDFKWVVGDKIKVTIGGNSAEFTMSSAAGSSSATFTGTMPGDGDYFEAQYPCSDTDPDISTQTYTPGEILPHDMMKFTGTSNTTSLNLKAVNAVLRLELYGLDRKVSKIEVTNLSDSKTYTLNVGDPVKIGTGEATATPFFVIVPSGSYKFRADVTVEEVNPNVDNTVHYVDNGDQGLGTVITYNNSLTPRSAKTFTAGEVLNMSAQPLTMVWAPVNCGYDADHPWGLFYQFGRIDGQGAYHATLSPNETEPTKQTVFKGTNGDYEGIYGPALSKTTFYRSVGSDHEDWIVDGLDTYWNKAAYPNDAKQTRRITPVKGDFDPCPDGWRLPTYYEQYELYGGNRNGWATVGGKKGFYFNGTATCTSSTTGAKVFLLAAGYRSTNGVLHNRSSDGYYRSSTVLGQYDYGLGFRSNVIGLLCDNRAHGLSVRCVLE